MRTIKELLVILLNEYQEIEGETYRNALYSDNGYAFGVITKKAVDKSLLNEKERIRLLVYLRTNKTEYVNQFLWWPPKYLNTARVEFLKQLIKKYEQ